MSVFYTGRDLPSLLSPNWKTVVEHWVGLLTASDRGDREIGHPPLDSQQQKQQIVVAESINLRMKANGKLAEVAPHQYCIVSK